MAKTNAEIQAAYRERHLNRFDRKLSRLNTVIDVPAKSQLERLAKHYGVSQRAIIERLLNEAESSLLDGMTPAEQSAYLD